MAPEFATRLRRALRRRSAVDPRALAAFRIGLGAVLLLDLGLRARSLETFYTDAGAVPRSVLFEVGPAYSRFSLHALSGAAWFQAVLFALAGVAALSLAVGYRSRVAAVASLVLLGSLQARNPLVLNGGDTLLLFLVLWSAFLPLGARWSVDSVRGQARDVATVAGVAPAALLSKVVVVYCVNVALKLQGESWLRGEAVRYVFGLDQFTVLLGDVLPASPGLLRVLDAGWIALLLASPLLLVLTGRARTAVAAAFAAGHLGMAATMRLGVFPLVSLVALVPFVHSGAWTVFCRWLPVEGVRRRVGRPLARNLPALDGVSVPERVASASRRGRRGLVAALLAAMLLWNLAAAGAVPSGVVEAPDSRWNMFAPEPMRVDAWYVAPATLVDGSRVDAFDGESLTWDRPPDVSATYPTARWRKYLNEIRRRSPAYRTALARHLCRGWNRAHAVEAVSVRVVAVEMPTRLDGPDPVRRSTVTRTECGGLSSEVSP
jgi:hypothetical protein